MSSIEDNRSLIILVLDAFADDLAVVAAAAEAVAVAEDDILEQNGRRSDGVATFRRSVKPLSWFSRCRQTVECESDRDG